MPASFLPSSIIRLMRIALFGIRYRSGDQKNVSTNFQRDKRKKISVSYASQKQRNMLYKDKGEQNTGANFFYSSSCRTQESEVWQYFTSNSQRFFQELNSGIQDENRAGLQPVSHPFRLRIFMAMTYKLMRSKNARLE